MVNSTRSSSISASPNQLMIRFTTINRHRRKHQLLRLRDCSILVKLVQSSTRHPKWLLWPRHKTRNRCKYMANQWIFSRLVWFSWKFEEYKEQEHTVQEINRLFPGINIFILSIISSSVSNSQLVPILLMRLINTYS